MGGHQASDPGGSFAEFGLESLHHCITCRGLFCERLEVSDCHCDHATVWSHDHLVVRFIPQDEVLMKQLSFEFIQNTFSNVCPRWLPESARWLISNGKVNRAHFYLNKCAKCNNREEFMADLKPEVND